MTPSDYLESIPHSILEDCAADYVSYLGRKGDVEPKGRRKIIPFRKVYDVVHNENHGANAFYLIQCDKSTFPSLIRLSDKELWHTHAPSEVIIRVTEQVMTTMRRAEAEWQAYWSSNLWC